MALWEVVGGADSGGILVREGASTSSKTFAERLSTGALVEELELQGSRLHYRRKSGNGPEEGWISIRLKDKDLAVRTQSFVGDTAGNQGAKEPKRAFAAVPEGTAKLRPLQPASELVGQLPGLDVRLAAFQPTTDRKDFLRRAALRLPGDLFGLPLPATPEEFASEAFGARWLTKAFHAAGTLPKENAVLRIVSWRRFEGGGSGPKTLFKVDYQEADDALDTWLFMKQPYSLEENKMQRVTESGLGRYGDVWGAEINFYRFISPHLPFPVPKYYFGDTNRESTEACIINAAVTWPETGKTLFGPYELLPPCRKCEDYELDKPHEYYFAMMRRLGTLAGLAKMGQLGSEMSDIHWSRYGPDPSPALPGMAKSFRQFVEEVSSQIWPAKVRSKHFLDTFVTQMDMVASRVQSIQQFLYHDQLYIGFCHQNGNTDNAYFYYGEDGTLRCGLLDWGSTGWMAYATAFMGSFGSCLGEMLVEYDDRLVHCFADAYHQTGAQPLSVDELTLHFRLSNAANTYALLGQVLPWLSEKHPQGRPFWKGIKMYNDPKIRSNFGLNFGVSMLYNKVVLWAHRMEEYWPSFEAWAKRWDEQRRA